MLAAAAVASAGTMVGDVGELATCTVPSMEKHYTAGRALQVVTFGPKRDKQQELRCQFGRCFSVASPTIRAADCVKSSLGFLSRGWVLQTWASNVALASFSSASAEVPRRGISRTHPHAPQRHPVKDLVSIQRNSRFAISQVYALPAAWFMSSRIG